MAGRTEEIHQIKGLISKGTESNSYLLLRPVLLGLEDMRRSLPSLRFLDGVVQLLRELEACEPERRLPIIGRCWVALSRALLEAYVPNLPLDPSHIGVQKNAIVAAQIRWVQSQIRVRTAAESAESNCDTNFYIEYLEQELAELLPRIEATRPSEIMGRDTDVRSLQSFWNEIRVFGRDIVFSNRIETLMASGGIDSAGLHAQHMLLQNTISNFTHRLKTSYIHYSDLLPAVELALFQFKFGLSIMCSNPESSCSDEQCMIKDILSFP